MKPKKLILIFGILLLGSLPLKAQNPYKSLGIEAETLTLSKGKFVEFFPNDSLVQIGSVMFNTRTNSIVSFVVYDTTYSEATLEPEVTSRFLQPDPLAAKYPNVSPYAYTVNNPINAVDPDGRLVIFINGQHNNNAGLYYWRQIGFDLRVMNHLNDYNAIYRDGAIGGWHNTLREGRARNNFYADNRYDAGYRQALRDFDAITARLSPEETIKIITHSYGSMYGRGYVAALKKLIRSSSDPAINAIQIDFIADFAPFQPTSYDAISGEGIGPTLQFSHCGDRVAGCDASEGAEQQDIEDGNNKRHSLSEFSDQIKNLPAGRYQVKNGKLIKIEDEEN